MSSETPGNFVVDDETLRAYLADALAPSVSARVEAALRASAELRSRLEDVRQNRSDGQLHTLGAIWRRGRLTCPSRDQLGSYLLDVLEPELVDYITFHIETVECPFCHANLADLREKSASSKAAASRQNRILHATRHQLSDDARS